MTEWRTRPVTNSELTLWRKDRRAHWIAYVHSLAPAHEPSTAVAVGNITHEALQDYYDGVDAQSIACALANNAAAADATNADVFADAMFGAYMEWLAESGADCGYTRFETEVEVSREIAPGVVLLGKVDAIATDASGRVWIMDHKTTGLPLDTFLTNTALSHQWPHYALITGIRDIVVNAIRRSKYTDRGDVDKPAVARRELTLSMAEVDRYRRDVIDEIAQMRSTDPGRMPPHGEHVAHGYAKHYRALDGLSDREAVDAIYEMFAPHDPLERYGNA